MDTMEMSPPIDKQIALWHMPRCLSTAVVRSMATFSNIHVLFEFFAAAAMLGPQPIYNPPSLKERDNLKSKFTYEWVKEHIESRSSEKDFVFITDPAYAIDGRYEMLPEGFQHTFIIRHPAKVFASWENILKSTKYDDLKLHMPNGACFKESYDLHEYVTSKLHQPSIVIDADDLVANPVETMRLFCHKLDLPFDEEAMFKWEAVDDEKVPGNWEISDAYYEETNILGWYKNNLFESTGLQEGTPLMVKWDDLSPEVSHYAALSMPFYNKLYKYRIKPGNSTS